MEIKKNYKIGFDIWGLILFGIVFMFALFCRMDFIL